MANAVDDGGGAGSGGTPASMCAISPSDLIGTIGNLITRIEKMEQILSQLLGANLAANSLSDISQQVGWVYGVEYMGIPGWIQTPAGTLIQPAGFSLSDIGFTLPNACTGEETPYQGVVMDENGVLQFGWTPTGELCGERVQDWGEAVLAAKGDTLPSSGTAT